MGHRANDGLRSRRNGVAWRWSSDSVDLSFFPHAVHSNRKRHVFVVAAIISVVKGENSGNLLHLAKAQEEQLALKSMPIGKLIEMRKRIDAILASKVADQRRTLQTELSKLARFQPNGSRPKIGARLGGVVAPKYRNPDNPAETWLAED